MNLRTRTLQLSLLLLSAVLLISGLTGCTRIGPGHAGIVISQAGSDRGVLNQAATTGWVFYNPFAKTVIEYQTSMRSVKWTKDPNEGSKNNEEITFTNADSMSIAADIGVSFSLDPSKVPTFYVKFLARDEEDLDNKFTNGYLRNSVRNCMNDNAGSYKIEQIMGDNKQFLADTWACIQKDVSRYGVTIDQFGLLAAPRPPTNVMNQINTKVQAEQLALQKQMELQQVDADAKKAVAEANGQAQATLALASAQADANAKIAKSLTSELVQYEAIKKWDGHKSMVEGSGSGVLLNLTK